MVRTELKFCDELNCNINPGAGRPLTVTVTGTVVDDVGAEGAAAAGAAQLMVTLVMFVVLTVPLPLETLQT
jgi:hypothetical protein